MTFKNRAIEGVVVKPLHRFQDARGWLIDLARRDGRR
jgi:dTDP-4-dehydrorhamnose 3,5-epimerase-like enzyme